MLEAEESRPWHYPTITRNLGRAYNSIANDDGVSSMMASPTNRRCDTRLYL